MPLSQNRCQNRFFSELSLAHAEELKGRLEELESTHRSELIRLTERLRNDHNTQLARINDEAEVEKAALMQVRLRNDRIMQ